MDIAELDQLLELSWSVELTADERARLNALIAADIRAGGPWIDYKIGVTK